MKRVRLVSINTSFFATIWKTEIWIKRRLDLWPWSYFCGKVGKLCVNQLLRNAFVR